MKKKFLVVLLAVVAALCLCFGLAACGEETPQTPSDTTETETGGGNNTPSDHVHAYGNWEVITPATHTATGTRRKYCSCGDHIDETIPAEGHTYENGVCSVCGSVEGLIAFRTLEVSDDDTVYGKVSNQTETFSFIQEILFADGVTFTVSYDLGGTNTIPTKTVSLEIGDNTYYVLASRGQELKLYTVTVRRRPVYNVTFETSGSAVSSQQVEEDQNIVQPAATARTGYTFRNWTLNGNAVTFPCKAEEGIPQTGGYNVTFTAVFTANDYKATLDAKGGEVSNGEQTVTFDQSYNFPVPTRTGYSFTGWYEGQNQLTNASGASLSAWTYAEGKQIDAHWSANSYKVTFDAKNGNLTENEQTVTFDQSYNFPIPTRTGYTFTGWYEGQNQLTNAEGTSLSAWKYAEGKQIEAHWSANSYMLTVESDDISLGTVTGGGTFPYDEDVTITAKVERLGYVFLGWYNDAGKQLSTEENYTFTMGMEQTITAKWSVAPEMTKFNFTSTSTTCTISGLKNKNISNVDIPAYVTSIGYATFGNCSYLRSVRITDLTAWCKIYFESDDANPLYYAHHLYLDGGEVKNLTIPAEIAEIKQYAFYGCSGLTSIEIPDSVTSIGNYAFRNCSGLQSVTIGSGVTSIGDYAFYNCTGLESVTIGSGVTSIGSWAFAYCSGLQSVTIGRGVTSIGYSAFYKCNGLTAVHITDLTSWCKIDFGSDSTANPLCYAHHLYLDGAEVEKLSIPAEVTEIKNYAFAHCSRLTSIVIPDGVTSIGDGAFYGCSGLTGELKIPDSVTSIGEYAFHDCTGFTSVVIPDSVTSIGSSAFSDCTGFTSVVIPDSVTSIGSSAFSGCSGLESVTFGNESRLKTINSYAFAYCSRLTSIEIPDSVTSIGAGAFYCCYGLQSVTIGDDVTSIGKYAFEDCDRLESVTIGDGVTSIGEEAFYKCSGLKAVYYKGTPSKWDGISIDDYGNSALTNATRYYYSDQTPSAEQWTESQNWWHYEADGETIVLWTKEQA